MKSTPRQGTHTGSAQKQLLPLMFEMGRLLKSEISREGTVLPSFLHLETLRFIQDAQKAGEMPTMSDISEYLKVARPTATALVNGFVKDGILKRTADPDDRRLVRLGLSVKGTELLKEIMRTRELAFKRVTASLTEKECNDLARLLTIITKPRFKKS